MPGTQGLYYYYLTLAKIFTVHKVPVARTAGGGKRDWARELSLKLMSLQEKDGHWVNKDGSWWEDEPVLVTSYALLTLGLCLDAHSFRAPR